MSDPTPEQAARVEAKLTHARGLARDLTRETLHGPPPLATTMMLAEAVTLYAQAMDAERAARQAVERERDEARADLAALRLEHGAVCGLLTHTRKDRDEARAELASLRAQVADLQRLGASIHKAADAARKAERMDTLACGSSLVNEYLAKNGGGGDYCAALHRLIGMVACGAHEGAATPK